METVNTKTLHLILKKKWFDMILSGEKPEEYRSITRYWVRRLFGPNVWFNKPDPLIQFIKEIIAAKEAINEILFDTVTPQNGYAANAPRFTIEFKGIDIGPAKPEWSDNWQGDCFRIKLGKVLSTENI